MAGRRLSAATIAYHRTVARRLGLNDTDHKCLDLLARNGPMTAGALAEATGYTTGAVTGVIDRLEAAGFAERDRDPADRRRVIVRPREEAVESRLVPLLWPMIQGMEAVNASYSEEDLRLVLGYLERTIEVLTDAAVELAREDEASS